MSAAATTTRTRLTAPALWAGAGLLAVGALAARDPHVHGTWGFCVFRSLTGLPCPGCGGLRAVNDLAHGQRRGPRWLQRLGRPLPRGARRVVGRVGGRPPARRAAPLGDHAVRLSLLWAGGFLAFGVLRLLPPFAGLQPAP